MNRTALAILSSVTVGIILLVALSAYWTGRHDHNEPAGMKKPSIVATSVSPRGNYRCLVKEVDTNQWTYTYVFTVEKNGIPLSGNQAILYCDSNGLGTNIQFRWFNSSVEVWNEALSRFVGGNLTGRLHEGYQSWNFPPTIYLSNAVERTRASEGIRASP